MHFLYIQGLNLILFFQGLLEDLNVRIPSGTSSHTVLTLADKGFKRLDSYNSYGNHYVHLKIKVPIQLTKEQRELAEEFAHLEDETPGTVNGVERNSTRPRWRREHKQTPSESEDKEASSNQSAEEQNKSFFTKLKEKLLGK